MCRDPERSESKFSRWQGFCDALNCDITERYAQQKKKIHANALRVFLVIIIDSYEIEKNKTHPQCENLDLLNDT